MTPKNEKSFLEWLDKEIGFALSNENAERVHALIQVREKFLTLTPPSTTLDNGK